VYQKYAPSPRKPTTFEAATAQKTASTPQPSPGATATPNALNAPNVAVAGTAATAMGNRIAQYLIRSATNEVRVREAPLKPASRV